MGKITQDDVRKLAALAKLQLSADEITSFAKEFSEIDDYVEQLKNVDTEGVKPTYQVHGLVNVMREDEVQAGLASPEELLKNAPEKESGQFKVKRMVG